MSRSSLFLAPFVGRQSAFASGPIGYLAITERYVIVEKYYQIVERLDLLHNLEEILEEAFFFKAGGTFPREAFPTDDEICKWIMR